MIDLNSPRRRPAHQRAVVTASLPIPLVQNLDDLAQDIGSNRNRLMAAAIDAGLEIVAAQAGRAAAQQQQAVKE